MKYLISLMVLSLCLFANTLNIERVYKESNGLIQNEFYNIPLNKAADCSNEYSALPFEVVNLKENKYVKSITFTSKQNSSNIEEKIVYGTYKKGTEIKISICDLPNNKIRVNHISVKDIDSDIYKTKYGIEQVHTNEKNFQSNYFTLEPNNIYEIVVFNNKMNEKVSFLIHYEKEKIKEKNRK